ncbi:myo-inositol 2-dehydrogenase (plasmid) [Rhizobium leguminosarum]|uniref:Myo-inositol 2-dehydrogenase n=1 Tax=Rhizobium leguminosarum TaxID=384 RepID=A0A1L3ZQ20_RHILE|nr:Gfo/Idh/MocA family oxidoreductase [Rhizobium leguminosarum]API57738.1 myo-inositol 2-dehydrogenase [Rhizobium leguminosarum]
MKRIGLIGAGVMGAEHARLLQEEISGVCLVAVSDSRADQASRTAKGARVYADPLELINSPDVDAVVIASPDATHAPFTRACIGTRKRVLVEKPLAPNAAECLAVVAEEVAGGVPLVTVGYMRRFDAAYGAMKAARLSGAIGRTFLLHNIHRNVAAPDWFTGAMAITNSFVHEIDISRYLLDDEVNSAQVVEAPAGGPILITMKTRLGFIVSSEVNINARYGYHVHAQLVGSEGTVEMAPLATIITNSNLQSGHTYPENWVPRFADAYRTQMQQWVAALETGERVGASAWDGYASTAIAETIAVNRRRREWIAIDLCDKPAFYN